MKCIFTTILVASIVTFITAENDLSQVERRQFIHDLTCKSGLKVLSSELYAGIVCFSNAYGVPFNETKGKFPPKMSKCIPQELKKNKILSSANTFKKWFCEQEPSGKSLYMMGECSVNMTENEEQAMHDCYIEIAGETVREQVCLLKDQKELSWQYEEYKCMRKILANNVTCLMETFGGTEKDLPDDKKIFAQWLCQDEHTPIALIHAQEACLFTDESSEEKDKQFVNCLVEVAKKVV